MSRVPRMAALGRRLCGNARSGIFPGDVRGTRVKRFIEGQDLAQLMLPECLDDFVEEDNPVRVVDAFIEELDLAVLGFAGVLPEATSRPSYHPATLLKIYLYGYLNQVQSSRRLERETRRNLEVIWLTGRLTPDFKTIAEFRRDNGSAICRLPRDPPGRARRGSGRCWHRPAHPHRCSAGRIVPRTSAGHVGRSTA